jgi:heme oxygenase (biliverdin-IX-beta and delta-forming)
VAPEQAVWTRLRAATASRHDLAERTLDPLTQPAGLGEYAELLTVLWGFQAPAERLLGAAPLPAAVGWADRARVPLLSADLADLGVDSALLPQSGELPELAVPAAAWGMLYVLEGMTLGGRVIRRRVTDRLGGAPVRYLAGHGERTRPMWRELGHLADTHVRSEEENRVAGQTAVATFAAFVSLASRADPGRARPAQLLG